MVKLTEKEKAAFLTEAIGFLGYMSREMDWGTRLYDTQILGIISGAVVARVIRGDRLSGVLEPCLLEYVKIVTKVIDAEPGLIRSMFKPGPTEQCLLN